MADSTLDPDRIPGGRDSDLGSDTDSAGTGERAAAGRDTVEPDGADIAIGRMFSTRASGHAPLRR